MIISLQSTYWYLTYEDVLVHSSKEASISDNAEIL